MARCSICEGDLDPAADKIYMADGYYAHGSCEREARAEWEAQHGVSSRTGNPLPGWSPKTHGIDAELACLSNDY